MGAPDDEILRFCEEQGDFGLIVMGSRGLGPIKRRLMGSVSESVVRHAPCPVLVARS
jgi:nucleotide-binding universal stress UspA family protein